jgi:hypothetical protein
MTNTSAGAHLDDGELLMLDDAASSSASSADAREHLAGCTRCADRLRVLKQHSRRISSLIAEIDLPADFRYPTLPATPQVRAIHPWWTQRRWQRAAAVLLVIGSLAAVPPVRAWTVAWVAKQIAALTGASRRDAAPVTPTVVQDAPQAAPPIDSGATLWFDAQGTELTIEVASPQASGTLTFSPSTRPMVGVEVVSGAGETPLVREHGVRLINSTASTASYRLAVPSGVQQVRVRIGDEAWRTFTRADVEAGRAIELRQR